jgi:hypothetical protein
MKGPPGLFPGGFFEGLRADGIDQKYMSARRRWRLKACP